MRSSGDLLADRRYQYGLALTAEGDHAAAADLFAQAVEIASAWAPAWFALGEARAKAGDRDGAAAALTRAADLDGAGVLGAPLLLAALGGGPVPESATSPYVARLFDEYAARFDAHLVGALGYRGPALLLRAIEGVAPSRNFARALDLGCGTGLMGAVLRERVGWLAGVDLSPAMVARAAEKGLYDALHVGEMTDALASDEPFDLVTAADVLVYVGDLGLFAFTVQRAFGDTDVTVGADRRFAHSLGHVRRRAEEAGFAVATCAEGSTRHDAGKDVPGLVAVLTRP